MALANVTYPSDGTVLNYLITFDYLDRTHIAVFVDGVDTTDVSSAYTFELTDDTHVDVTTLAGAAVPSGSTIKIARITPTNTTATVFADGAVVRASALNANTDQLLFISQEVKDNDAFRLGVANDDKFDALSKVIKNVVDPTNAQDAATKNYVDTASSSQVVAATTQATNSSNSAAAALASQTASAASEAAALVSENAAAASVVTASGHVTSTTANAVSTAADAVSTSADATSTAADRVQTGLDATASSTSATNAEDWAIKTTGIVDSTGYSAKAWSIGGTGVTSTAGAGAAQEWATNTTTSVDGTEYAAKEYSIGTGQNTGMNTGSAKQWSLGGGASFDRDTAVTGSGLTAEYSAKYWANQAANSAQDFVDVYYGSFTSDTAAEDYQINDNLGSVNVGDLYFDSTNNVMRVRSFSGWNDVAADTTNFATNGFAIAMAIAL